MKTSRSNILFVAAILFSLLTAAVPAPVFAQTAPAKSTASDLDQRLAAIEQKVDARRKELGIPGIAIAIVKDGKVIYLKGLGVKDIAKNLPVTPDTQFAIGSATKAFTALSVLMSQDEGKLSVDDSPKKYLPYFKMYDPDTDKNITIRDLLSHSSGLNRTDLAMITGKLTRAELIQVAAQAKPTAKLHEKFQYQNIMFTAAGAIVAEVQKMPWEKFIANDIFKPLGMTNSDLSIAEMERSKDHSLGYNYNFDTKTAKLLPYRGIDQVAPAGAINSSARDMAKWIEFILNGGVVNGKRLVSEASFAEWLKPQMNVTPDGSVSYGFGWFLQKWNGMKVVQHGGNIDGFNSMVAMIPEKNVGFVMLSNVTGSSLGSDMMPIVWSGLLNDKPEAAPVSAEEMTAVAGKYLNEKMAAMNIDIKIQDGKLVFETGGQHYTLDHVKGREFKLSEAPDGFSVTFSPETGPASEMLLKQPQGNFNLKKQTGDTTAEKTETKSSASAKELAGKYSPPGGPGSVEIAVKGDSTMLNIPGQQPYTLLETSKDTYSLSPLPETYSLKPVRDDAGKVIAVVVTQPEGSFRFDRTGDADAPIVMKTDELMAKIIEAAGGEDNIRKVKTRVTEFDMDLENQGVKGFGKLYAKAPNLSASETTFTALGKEIGKGFDYFNGTTGGEDYSFSDPEDYTGKRLADAKLAADIYSTVDWRKDFKTIEITGKKEIDGEEAYAVRFDPNEGTSFTDYYSTKTFLLLERNGVIPSSTSSVELPYSVKFSDYREVDGLMIPFKTINFSQSNGNIVTNIKSVKQNVPIPDSIFAPRELK